MKYWLPLSLGIIICSMMAESLITIPLTKMIPRERTSLENGAYSPFGHRWLEPGSKAAVHLTDVSNVRYYGTLTIGRPQQFFNFIFDTGSADMFVLSKKCEAVTPNCTLLPRDKYDFDRSLDSTDLGTSLTLKYRNGSSVSGTLSSDTVFVSGIIAIGQTFLEVTDPWNFFKTTDPFDGLAGLAFSSIAQSGGLSLIDTMIATQALLGRPFTPVFAFYLKREPLTNITPNGEGGELTLGGFNPALFVGDITYVPVTIPQFWQFTLDKVTNICGGVVSCPDGCVAIADTGSNLIFGPPSGVAAVNDLILATPLGGGVYGIGCTYVGRPAVTFVIGGRDFVLEEKDYIVASEVDGSGKATKCISAFATTNAVSARWVLGNVFFGRYYSIFDVGNERIGFATAVQ